MGLRFVLTGDGSPTIYDESVDEHHHSLIGAYTEARDKFAAVARAHADHLPAGSRLHVLDLPMGLGYNIAATEVAFRGTAWELEFVGIEQDPQVVAAINVDTFPEDWRWLLAWLREGKAEVLVGDLRELLPGLDSGGFEFVFYDPFSPRRAPHMWHRETVLRPLARVLAPEGLLVTYTASNKVRRGLRDLGLQVGPSVAVGRAMPGTLASWQPIPDNEGFGPDTEAKIARATSY